MIKAPKYNGAGIYGIYNATRKKWYIGSSATIKSRILQHSAAFHKGKSAIKMQSDFTNGDAFVAYVLEIIDDNNTYEYMLNREKYFITKYDSINNGYNTHLPIDVERCVNRLLKDIEDRVHKLKTEQGEWRVLQIKSGLATTVHYLSDEYTQYRRPIHLGKRKVS